MENEFERETIERLARIETLLLDVTDLKTRVRRLEIGFVAILAGFGGFELITKVMLL